MKKIVRTLCALAVAAGAFALMPAPAQASTTGCWLGDCTVTPSEYAPACDMTVVPASISPGTPAVLTWHSNLLSPYLTPNSGVVARSGTLTLSPNQSTTFTLYDNAGAYGSLRYWLYVVLGIPTPMTYCWVQLTVSSSPAGPTCLLYAFPDTVVRGRSTTLYYVVQGTASSATLSGQGQVPLSPPQTYGASPNSSTTYQLSVSGPGGNTKCTTLVTVGPAPQGPFLDIAISPVRVRAGGSLLIAWSGYNVASCTVRDSFGTVIGQTLTNPVPAPLLTVAAQTTYTLSCVGQNGATYTKSVTVQLLPSIKEI